MNRIVLVAALASMCIVSCTKNHDEVHANGHETVVLDVSVPVYTTRAVGVTDADEAKVSGLQVFVFSDDGFLDASGSISGSLSVSLSCKVGQKNVVAITNAPAIEDVHTLPQLQDKLTFLEDNAPGHFIMTGMESLNVISSTASVTVPVSRRVARISLSSVSNSLASVVYQGMKFRIEKVYLINAAGSTGYLNDISPSKWYNAGSLTQDETNANIRNLLNDTDINAEIACGSGYSVSHEFYCYPNSGTMATESSGGAKCTKLVIEASLGGKTYYYPVAIGNILPNCKYNVTVDITRPGSLDPDEPVSFYDAAVRIDVRPWDDGYDTDITI